MMISNPITVFTQRRRRLATTDLYFFNPLKLLGISPWRVKQIGNHIYQIGQLIVISRYATQPEIDNLPSGRSTHVVYIADDDFLSGAADESLPPAYRGKLRDFSTGPWRSIKKVAHTVLISSPLLTPQYSQPTHYVHPLWDLDPPNTKHFDDIRQFDLAYFGSRSHEQDFAAIESALLEVLKEYRHVRLTTWLSQSISPKLIETGQTRAYAQQPWYRYKKAIGRQRFHLALYPLKPTTFNSARSSNKIFEHSATGAASLLSPLRTLYDLNMDSISSAIVEGDLSEWKSRIRTSIESPDKLKASAEDIFSSINEYKCNGNAILSTWSNLLEKTC